jgi:hypothetical protein
MHACVLMHSDCESSGTGGVAKPAARQSAEVASESPSLRVVHAGDPAAYELKFVLSEAAALELERSFRSVLQLDPHADPRLDRSYRITTLYTDTASFDVFHRVGSHRRSKFRLRTYGDQAAVFLERKIKRGQAVSKRRATVAPQELSWLTQPAAPEEWAGAWYRQQLSVRGLQPVCRVSYLRRAYFGSCADGPLRLTFDRHLCGMPAKNWEFDRSQPETVLPVPGVVCEFKFRGFLPSPFKAAMERLQLVPGGFSKYRQCVQACGLISAPEPRNA